jgi:DNA-binding beta-propeller fold protein YncE
MRGAAMSVRMKLVLFTPVVAAVALLGWRVHAQTGMPPTNDAPNPYTTVKDFFKLPEGRVWGSTSAVDIDKDGHSIWIAERCGANSCVADPTTGKLSTIDPILHYEASGKLIKAFGAGMFSAPHGIFVDRDGNVWITDYQDNAIRAARGAGAGGAAGPGGGRAAAGGGGQAARGGAPAPPAAPPKPDPSATMGHQVFKFSRDGKLLMTVGKKGGSLDECCFQPNDVLVAPNGDIFVSQGHNDVQGSKQVIWKFDKTGKFIKSFGQFGHGPGEFDQPHSLAMDSRGRLFVGDRNNNRVQIFDQDGKFLDQWAQFSRPSGVFIDKNDMLYVADSESMSVSRNHDGWKRGLRIGSVKDGKVMYFIPDPDENATGTSAAEGVVADSQGNVYGAEVGPRQVKKYVKK